MAFALDDPIAGAAFWPSVLPICKRLVGRKVCELVVDRIDPVGLFGRSGIALADDKAVEGPPR